MHQTAADASVSDILGLEQIAEFAEIHEITQVVSDPVGHIYGQTSNGMIFSIDDHEISSMTITSTGDQRTIDQIEKQLNKLIEVIKVRTLKKDECFARELMMVKLSCTAEKSFLW